MSALYVYGNPFTVHDVIGPENTLLLSATAATSPDEARDESALMTLQIPSDSVKRFFKKQFHPIMSADDISMTCSQFEAAGLPSTVQLLFLEYCWQSMQLM